MQSATYSICVKWDLSLTCGGWKFNKQSEWQINSSTQQCQFPQQMVKCHCLSTLHSSGTLLLLLPTVSYFGGGEKKASIFPTHPSEAVRSKTLKSHQVFHFCSRVFFLMGCWLDLAIHGVKANYFDNQLTAEVILQCQKEHYGFFYAIKLKKRWRFCVGFGLTSPPTTRNGDGHFNASATSHHLEVTADQMWLVCLGDELI